MIEFIHKTEKCEEVMTTLTLSWSRRIKSRQRVLLDNTEDAGLFLERGVILRGGDCLVSKEGIVIRVQAAEETVSIVSCGNSLQLARVCYHLGNRHVALEIRELQVRYLHDHVLDGMVQGMGLTTKTIEAPFEPETGAYGEEHGHSHG
jgi:urease accessory protein